ncbi:MAG: hypothetical protein AB7G37_21260, partial [Solirubrobacteraceae bacterium]
MFNLGRIRLDDPESFSEAVGEDVARVGAAVVAGPRSGSSVSVGLTTFPASDASTVADRERVRRQMRSLLNNLPARGQGLYVAWTEDPEVDGWYVPGAASIDLADTGALASGFWRFGGLTLELVGRPRTHRRGVLVYRRDRRQATVARDTLRRVYSTNFAAMTPTALTWLPSAATDPTLTTTASVAVSSARPTADGGSVQAIVGAPDGAVATFEQSAAHRTLADVVLLDRRGVTAAPTSGPNAAWEELYGPDWPLYPDDVPVLENGIARVRWLNTNTPGFALDRWTGTAWLEVGKVLVERIGDTTGFVDTLVRADVYEWAPDRAVVRVVLRRAADAYSREEVFLTLQRGWTGPRVEVYPGPRSSGAAAGAGVYVFRAAAPSGTETANKYDASLVTVSAVTFTPGAVGAATFSGENWLVMRRSGVPAVALAVLQSGAGGRVEASASAYGATRNGLSVRH